MKKRSLFVAAWIAMFLTASQAHAVTFYLAATVMDGLGDPSQTLTGSGGLVLTSPSAGAFGETFVDAYAEYPIFMIPAGATINSATLDFNYEVDPVGGGTSPISFDVYTYDSLTLGGNADGSITGADYYSLNLQTFQAGFSSGAPANTLIDASTPGTSLAAVVAANFTAGGSHMGTLFFALTGDALIGNHSAIPGTDSVGNSTAGVPVLVLDITLPNTPPVAAQSVGTYNYNASTTNVDLDGAGSFDPDGDPIINYSWTVQNTSANVSSAVDNAANLLHITQTGLTSASGAGSTVPAIAGLAGVNLVVTDSNGALSTNPNEKGISYLNSAPSNENAGPDLAFTSAMTSQTATGSGADPDMAINNLAGPGGTMPANFETLSYTWSHGPSTLGSTSTTNNATVTFAQAVASGMTQTSNGTITLNVTDKSGTGTGSGDNSLQTIYNGSAATSVSVSATSVIGGNTTFNGAATDADLAVNASFPGWENVQWEFDLTAAATAGDVGTGTLPSNFAQLTGTHSGTSINFNIVANALSEDLIDIIGVGSFQIFFNVTDEEGNTVSSPAGILTLAGVPEPATLALWSILGLMLAGFVTLRRRKA